MSKTLKIFFAVTSEISARTLRKLYTKTIDNMILDERLPEYRQKLIRKILASTSENQVRRYIETAKRTLSSREINGYIIERFWGKLMLELEKLMINRKKGALSDNILSAIQVLLKMKSELNQPKRTHSLFS